MAESDEENWPRRTLDEAIKKSEARKLQARREKDRTLWFGLSTWGLIGWAIAGPTLAGALLGLWLDQVAPQPRSWTLGLLLLGLAVGCFQAWYWVAQEQRNIGRSGNGKNHD